MLISTLFILWQVFEGPVLASQGRYVPALACERLFSTPDLAEKTFTHLLESDTNSHGLVDNAVYLRLNSVTQLRFYTESPIEFIHPDAVSRVLKLEVLEDLGISTREEVHQYQQIFQPESLKVIRLDFDQYSVGRWVPRRTVPVDIHTGFIRADSPIVTEILSGLIKIAREKSDSAMMFLDIDVLNLVNYLPGGHALGDKYISTILKIISDNLRVGRKDKGDIAFRMQGGDEYFFILQAVNPRITQAIEARIYEAFRNSRELADLLKDSFMEYQNFLDKLNSLESFNELKQYTEVEKFIIDSKMWQSLGEYQRNQIRSSSTDFKTFIFKYTTSSEATLRGQRILALPLGASLASVIIEPAHTYSNLVSEADAQMQSAKTTRKDAHKRSMPSDLVNISKSDIHFPAFQN